MTARAFLRLSDGLREAFASAQDDETLRYLRVEVVSGDCLEAVGSKQKGDLETDFDALAQASGRQACKVVLVLWGFASSCCWYISLQVYCGSFVVDTRYIHKRQLRSVICSVIISSVRLRTRRQNERSFNMPSCIAWYARMHTVGVSRTNGLSASYLV